LILQIEFIFEKIEKIFVGVDEKRVKTKLGGGQFYNKPVKHTKQTWSRFKFGADLKQIMPQTVTS